MTLAEKTGLLSSILSPLGGIYGLLQRLRSTFYQLGILTSHKLPLKVICVGNLTVGGTGKTPTVIQLTRLLQRNNRKVAILSRGYKRNSKEEILAVSKGQGPAVSWQEAGDEPYLLAQELSDVPIVVGKKRYLAGQHAIANFSPHVLLLDDGYQHLALQRDINLLVINAANPFGNGYLLPAGVLREPLTAIKRANIILLSKFDQAETLTPLIQLIRKYNSQAPIFKAVHQSCALVELATQTDWTLGWLEGKQIATLSGIGDPGSFKHLAESLGAQVVKEGRYPDHHAYTQRELEQLEQACLAANAEAILTTSKDALRLPPGLKTQLPLLVLKIKLKIVENRQAWEKFWKEI